MKIALLIYKYPSLINYRKGGGRNRVEKKKKAKNQEDTLMKEKKNENIKSNFSIPEEEEQAKLFDTSHFHTYAKK